MSTATLERPKPSTDVITLNVDTDRLIVTWTVHGQSHRRSFGTFSRLMDFVHQFQTKTKTKNKE